MSSNENKYYVGQVVEYAGFNDYNIRLLTVGRKYIVLGIHIDIYIIIETDNGQKMTCHPCHFKPVGQRKQRALPGWF